MCLYNHKCYFLAIPDSIKKKKHLLIETQIHRANNYLSMYNRSDEDAQIISEQTIVSFLNRTESTDELAKLRALSFFVPA